MTALHWPRISILGKRRIFAVVVDFLGPFLKVSGCHLQPPLPSHSLVHLENIVTSQKTPEYHRLSCSYNLATTIPGTSRSRYLMRQIRLETTATVVPKDNQTEEYYTMLGAC